MKKFLILNFLCFVLSSMASAQIGYQVSLLNNATGEPRANERVAVTVKITDSEGKTVCEETKNETSNDFGVLSMSVGNIETFSNADWSKLPFFIEASVDGRLIGKSQLLSVPVAEHAKHTGSLTKEILMSRKWDNGDYPLKFTEDKVYVGSKYVCRKYIIEGNFVLIRDAYYTDDGHFANEQGFYFYDGETLIPINRID